MPPILPRSARRCADFRLTERCIAMQTQRRHTCIGPQALEPSQQNLARLATDLHCYLVLTALHVCGLAGRR